MNILARAAASHRCFIEPLESRVAPAGIVAFNYDPATGALTLTGDIESNSVKILPSGPGTHRVEGLSNTTFTGGESFLDFEKLTSVTFNGNEGVDGLNLQDLNLNTVTFNGGDGGDLFFATNLTVKGNLSVNGGPAIDDFVAVGLFTRLGGNVELVDPDVLTASFNAISTTIKGSVEGTGGTGQLTIEFEGRGPVAVGKGIQMNAGTGGSNINLLQLGAAKIGKLPSGESILLNGNSGNDIINFRNGNATLASGIRLLGAAGENQISVGSGIVAVKLGKLSSGQSILLTTAGTETELDINSASFTASGGIEFTATGGTNEITLQARSGKIALGKLSTGESVRFEAGAGDDTFELDSGVVTFAGGIDFKGGDGANSLQFVPQAGHVRIGKLPGGESINFAGGSGVDAIESEVAELTLLGGIFFAPGSGTNSIELNGTNGLVSLGKLKTGESVMYNGGSGKDTFRSDQTTVLLAGGINFNGGTSGANDLRIASAAVLKIGKLFTGNSVEADGGVNNDSIILDGGSVVLKGAVTLEGRDGIDRIQISGNASLGKNAEGDSILLSGGDANDVLDLDAAAFLSGSISFLGGAGEDRLEVEGETQVIIKGGTRFEGGPGNDYLGFDAHELQITGPFSYLGGDDLDYAIIDANGSIGGDVQIDLGASNDLLQQEIEISSRGGRINGLTLRGSVDLSTGGTDSNEVLLENVVVGRDLTITINAGANTVTIDNLTVRGAFNLSTGDGADVVTIERGSFFGPSVIARLATIQLGGGNDTLLIGSSLSSEVSPFPDPSTVRFLGGLTIDGGTGTNTRNDIIGENDFPGGPPTGLETFTILIA